MVERLIEWQVCGACNYDCSYCIQSKKYRSGQPSRDDTARFIAFFCSMAPAWELKVSGGEPFAFPGFMQDIVPSLVRNSPHTLSLLTNLSAPSSVLEHFARLTWNRLGIISASLHLESVSIESFLQKVLALRACIAHSSRMVVNSVLVPGRLHEVARAKALIEAEGLRFFPQLMKVGKGTFPYSEHDRDVIRSIVGDSPSPHTANMAPSYCGRLCRTGMDYFVLGQTGDAYKCRTAKRYREGYLGNVLTGSFALRNEPEVCTYPICPCTPPATRGMIEL